MSAEVDQLAKEVARIHAVVTAVEQTVLTLIEDIAQRLEEAKDDPAQVAALANSLKASADALAAAGIRRMSP